MIEFLGFLGFLIVTGLTRHLAYEHVFIVNATASICIVFILYVRVFLHVCLDRVLTAKKRYPILCFVYSLLLLEASFAVLYFTKEFEYCSIKNLLLPTQIFMYSFSFLMFVFVKHHDWLNRKLYGKVYVTYIIIDTVLVLTYLLFDIVVTPEILMTAPNLVYVFAALLCAIFLVNINILLYKPYWLHKRALLIQIEKLIKSNQEIDLIDPPKKILQENEAVRELVYTLDYSPIRIFEVVLLVRTVYKLMLKTGRSYEESSIIAAGYANVIVLNLMKRKYDFSYLPSFVVKLLQKKPKPRIGSTANRRGKQVD